MFSVNANGAAIPALGFGTYRMGEIEAEDCVRDALDIGYRHIDTAQIYENEAGVGKALSGADIPRDEIFLTTKVWPSHFGDGSLQASVDESLERLRTDYVDLLLLHWPKFDRASMEETIEALNKVRRARKALHIGVSNFTVSHVQRTVELSQAPLVTNQVEYHPYLRQTPVLSAVREAGISLTAYAPIARAKVTDDETLIAIGENHRKKPTQVALRWLLQQDKVIAIPKASSPEHRRTNIDLFDFELSDEEMAAIHGLARPDGRLVSPSSVAPEWDEAHVAT